MPENPKETRQGDLLAALDSLTGLIAQRERRGGTGIADSARPHFLYPEDPFSDAVSFGEPFLPDAETLETLIDQYLDRRLAVVREELKQEILAALRERFSQI